MKNKLSGALLCLVEDEKCTYIVRCGEYSVWEVVEGEITRWIYFYERHLLFGGGIPLDCAELLRD